MSHAPEMAYNAADAVDTTSREGNEPRSGSPRDRSASPPETQNDPWQAGYDPWRGPQGAQAPRYSDASWHADSVAGDALLPDISTMCVWPHTAHWRIGSLMLPVQQVCHSRRPMRRAWRCCVAARRPTCVDGPGAHALLPFAVVAD